MRRFPSSAVALAAAALTTVIAAGAAAAGHTGSASASDRAAAALAAGPTVAHDHGSWRHHRSPWERRDGDLAPAFMGVDRSTGWKQTGALHLDFQTFHTEGIAFTKDRIFLSAVEILEPTVKYPTPQNGYDRTPGKGIGHLFVMDRSGRLIKDIHLGDGGDIYHPGGIDTDGTSVWVPVAEYRPDSASIIYRVDAKTLGVHEQFRVEDHIGGIVLDRTTNHLVGNTWGSRRFAEWTPRGREVAGWLNESHFIDYQDCQYVDAGKALCGGVTNLPQTPSAGGAAATYELGGMALLDLHSHDILHEVPFQQFSPAGHVMTRNPLKVEANGSHLTLRVAPDNGEEVAGTVIYTYEADVTPHAVPRS